MKNSIKMSILPLFICLSLNGKALADLSCNELNYKDYIWSVEKTQKLIAETGKGCNLIGADLTGADLIGAFLRWADLIGANLRGAVLTEAVLRGAFLTEADLTGADLREADLRGAFLTEADLTGADLIGANLRRAVLTGADLTGANLTHWLWWTNADLKSAKYDDKTQFPEGFNPIKSRMSRVWNLEEVWKSLRRGQGYN